MSRTLRNSTLLSLLLFGSGSALRGAYIYESVDHENAVATLANGIGADGRIVGEYADANGVTHAFTFLDGAFAEFDVPGAAGYSSANGVNAAGKIVGLYSAADGSTHGYLQDGNRYVDLVPLRSSPFTQALSINEAGDVVGSFVDGNFLMRGFRYNGRSFETLSFHGAETVAIGLNNTGSVVGAYQESGSVHGFRYSEGNYVSIDVPNSTWTEAQGINDAGQIGGLYLSPAYRYHGFVLHDDGAYELIHMPNALETKVFAINGSGQIVGAYLGNDGRTRGFVANPVAPSDATGIELTDLPGISVSANSNSGAGGEPENAIDNLDYAEGLYSWVAGDHGSIGDPNWLQVDLGANFQIAGVELRGIFNDPNLGYEGYDNVFNLLVSQDGSEWTSIGSGVMVDSRDASLRDESFNFAPDVQALARYVRYEVVGGAHWSTLGEINVQGTLPGDANGDLQVDLVDLNLVRNNFGLSGDGIEGDTNGDDTIDLIDLNHVRNNFGSAVTQAVPEPATNVLAAMGLVAIVMAGIRRREVETVTMKWARGKK